MYPTLSFLLASIAIILGLTIIQSLLFVKDFRLLLRAPQTLEKRYVHIFDNSQGYTEKLIVEQKKNVPFIVKTSQTRYVAVSSPGHIYELSNAPAEKLSLIAFFSEFFHMPYTMNAIQTDQTRSHHRVLRRFTDALPSIEGQLHEIIATNLRHILEPNGVSKDEWVQISPYHLAEEVIGNTNFHAFFGDYYHDGDKFVQTANRWIMDTMITSELLNLTPKFLAPFVAWASTRNHRALRALREILIPAIETGLQHAAHGRNGKSLYYIECLASHYSNQKQASASDMAQQFLAVWLPSVHLSSMTLTYALYDIAQHPQHLSHLRSEIDANWLPQGPNLQNMPFLDAILRESGRLNASETISLRRTALTDYTFTDNFSIRRGDILCAPLRAMGLDPITYPDPTLFNPARFFSPNPSPPPFPSLPLSSRSSSYSTISSPPTSRSSSYSSTTSVSSASSTSSSPSAEKIGGAGPAQIRWKYTDNAPEYPFWGLGREACPGRFYIALVIKSVVGHLLRGYEVRLLDEGKTRGLAEGAFSWRTTRIPCRGKGIEVRRRKV